MFSKTQCYQTITRKIMLLLKADKGSKVVVLDKDDYYIRVEKQIPTDPLPKIINEVISVITKCNNLINPQLILVVSC